MTPGLPPRRSRRTTALGVLQSRLLATSLVVALGACELSSNFDVPRKPGVPSYSADVQPIFDAKCVSCHAASVRPVPQARLALDSWEQVMRGSAYGEVVIPFDADNSLILEMTTKRVSSPHPSELEAASLSDEEIDKLRTWIEAGAPDDQGTVPFADARDLLFVCNQEDATVSIIDTERNIVIRLVDLTDYGLSSGSKPHHVAVEPDGSYWYVSLIGDNRVVKFDAEHRMVGMFVFETPGMLALDPASDWLYVGRSLSALNPPASIGKIRRTDMTGELIPIVFPRPHALTTSPDGRFVYTASLGQNQLITFDVAGDNVVFTAVDGPLRSFVQHAVSPDGALLAGTAQLTNEILFFDLTQPAQPVWSWSIAVNAAPWHPVFTRDGRFVFAGNKDANTVSRVSVANRRVEAIIVHEGIADPHGAALSPDGSTLYISNRNTSGSYVPRHDLGDNADDGTVVVIDVATGEVLKVLEVGRFTAGISARRG